MTATPSRMKMSCTRLLKVPCCQKPRYHGGRGNRYVDDIQARTGHVSEIEAVAVDEEIVDPSPASLLEPRELDGIRRIGNVEDQQTEVAVVPLYADYGQIARDLDVHRGSGSAHLGYLAHAGRIGDVDDMDDAAKVAHQRVVPREIEVGPVRRFAFLGKADEDDFADAFHIEAVGGIVGGKDGVGCVADGFLVTGGGRGDEEDQQRQHGPVYGRLGLWVEHGRSSWSQGRQGPIARPEWPPRY